MNENKGGKTREGRHGEETEGVRSDVGGMHARGMPCQGLRENECVSETTREVLEYTMLSGSTMIHHYTIAKL